MGTAEAMATFRRAECHPELRYHAKGMCYSCYLRSWARNNPDRKREHSRNSVPSDAAKERALYRKRNRHYIRQYGLTLAEVDELAQRQGNLCSICSKPPQHSVFGGKESRLHVDHDHGTGTIRGLICSHCNTGLGKFMDDPTTLRLAADYLEKHRGSIASPEV